MQRLASLLLSGITALLFPQTVLAENSGLTVVELFTSQGCSSCPPADKLLGELANQYGENVIALGYHVDYWNYIGWDDPFSKEEFTAYQRRYANAMNSSRVYTPQMVINGQHDVVGSRRNNVLSTIMKTKNKIIDVPYTLIQRKDNILEFSVDPVKNLIGSEVSLVTYIPALTTHVQRGENRGKKLINNNIVEEIISYGKYEGKPMSKKITLLKEKRAVLLFRNPQNMYIVAATKF